MVRIELPDGKESLDAFSIFKMLLGWVVETLNLWCLPKLIQTHTTERILKSHFLNKDEAIIPRRQKYIQLKM